MAEELKGIGIGTHSNGNGQIDILRRSLTGETKQTIVNVKRRFGSHWASSFIDPIMVVEDEILSPAIVFAVQAQMKIDGGIDLMK